MQRKHLKFGLGAIGIILTAIIWWGVQEGPLRNPEATMEDFLAARNRAEDQLMDPLILNGKRVVPLVIKEIQNRNMRLRRYAIGFLGNGQYAEAIQPLEKILRDDAEIYYFRADALEALYQIAPTRAHELAPKYLNGPDLLGRVAHEIVGGRNPVHYTRSYWQALTGYHE